MSVTAGGRGTVATHFGPLCTCNVGKVVVLVVVADVVGEPVERAVVRVRLLALHERVVLRHKVTGHGVEAHTCGGTHMYATQHTTTSNNKQKKNNKKKARLHTIVAQPQARGKQH